MSTASSSGSTSRAIGSQCPSREGSDERPGGHRRRWNVHGSRALRRGVAHGDRDEVAEHARRSDPRSDGCAREDGERQRTHPRPRPRHHGCDERAARTQAPASGSADHARLPRRRLHSADEPQASLRPAMGQAEAVRRAPQLPRARRADRPHGRRPRGPRRGRCARADPRAASHGSAGHRGLPAVLVRQSRARAARARADRRRASRRKGLALARSVPALARVRPHEHDARGRVPEEPRRRVHPEPRGRLAAGRNGRQLPGDEVQRRARRPPRSGGQARRPDGLGACRRRAQRDLLRAPRGARERDLDGHGRDELRRQPDRRRGRRSARPSSRSSGACRFTRRWSTCARSAQAAGR